MIIKGISSCLQIKNAIGKYPCCNESGIFYVFQNEGTASKIRLALGQNWLTSDIIILDFVAGSQLEDNFQFFEKERW